MEAYNQRVPSLCDNDQAHWLEHSDLCIVALNTHARDTIHLNGRGISFLVCNYKLKVSANLGLHLHTAHGTGFPRKRHSTSSNSQNEQSMPPASRSEATPTTQTSQAQSTEQNTPTTVAVCNPQDQPPMSTNWYVISKTRKKNTSVNWSITWGVLWWMLNQKNSQNPLWLSQACRIYIDISMGWCKRDVTPVH